VIKDPETLMRRRFLNAGVLASVTLLNKGVVAQTNDLARSAEATLSGWIGAFNSGESTGRFFTRDATLVRGNGVFVGAERIDDMERRESKAGLRLALKVQPVEQLGTDGVWALADYELTVPGKEGAAPQVIPGVSLHILERHGERWQMRVSSFTRVQQPPPRTASAGN
jgi:ketosteroid isomerase-like protein